MKLRGDRHTHRADVAFPTEGNAVQGSIAHDALTFQGKDREDPVVIDVLGPGLDYADIGYIMSQIEAKVLRK